MADVKRLARVHRVRTLQLNLARADEARARDQVASETLLSARIAELAAAVAPAGGDAGATALAAMAHYRERLAQSAETATHRVRAAEQQAERRAAATRAAWQDQSAIDKLIQRGQAELVRAELKALENLPVSTGRKRHETC